MWYGVGLLTIVILLAANIDHAVEAIGEMNMVHSSTATYKNQSLSCDYSICESSYTLENGYTFPCLKVYGMKDTELEDKINDSLTKYFFILTDPWFRDTRVSALTPIIHLQSPKYLSVEYIFRYTTAENKYWHFCVTVDMENGEVIFLDDLIDIDDDFALLVKHGRILRREAAEYELTAEETTKYENDFFAKQDTDYIKRFFNGFTREYLYGDYYRNNGYDMLSMNTYLYSNYFYLEEENICFTTANSTALITKIRIDDLEGEYIGKEDTCGSIDRLRS